MVARTPPKQRKMLAALNPVLIRETLNKVDRCMARLQELQYTVAGGTKVVSGVSLSPRSTRVYLRTSLRCKQESARVKNGASKRSPVGKFPFPANTGEWKRMSLPAMLVGETVGEILQATQFAREIVSAVGNKFASEDPKTPMSHRSNQKAASPENNTQLKARRKKEKQTKNDSSPSLQRARSRINFKVSPPKVRELDLQNHRYLANRVSPRNKPWARKTVLFPNPLFLSTHSSSQSQQQQFCKTRSPIISRNRGTTPHKFLVKTPPSTSKFKGKNKSPPPPVSLSPTRPTSLSRSSPTRRNRATPHKFLIKSPTLTSKIQAQIKSPRALSISPTRPANLGRSSPTRNRATTPHKFLIKSPALTSKIQAQTKSPRALSISPTRPANFGRGSQKRSATSKFRRSFSPSRIASRLASLSPLKRKKTVQKSDGFVSGLKQRPAASTVPLNTVRRV